MLYGIPIGRNLEGLNQETVVAMECHQALKLNDEERQLLVSPWTVKGDNYRQMIQEYLLPHLEDLDMQHLWFQQDGAIPHTARETMAIL